MRRRAETATLQQYAGQSAKFFDSSTAVTRIVTKYAAREKAVHKINLLQIKVTCEKSCHSPYPCAKKEDVVTLCANSQLQSLLRSV